MLVAASVTDHFVTIATDFIRHVGLPGVFVLMAAAATAIPFPSEATMLFAGFNVHDGHQTMVGVVIAGVLGDLFGATIAYSIGYYGRMGIMERHGSKLHFSPKRLERVEGFFDRWGTLAIFFGRMIPIVRALISFPAGSARMPYPKFAVATVLGAIPYVLGLAVLGDGVGSNWTRWRSHLAYVDYVFVLGVVAGIVYLVVRSRFGRTPDDDAAVDAPR